MQFNKTFFYKDLNYHLKKHALKEVMEKSSPEPTQGSQREAPIIQFGNCKEENAGEFEEDAESAKSFGERASFEGAPAENELFGGKSAESAATYFEPGSIEFGDFEKRLKDNVYKPEGVKQ